MPRPYNYISRRGAEQPGRLSSLSIDAMFGRTSQRDVSVQTVDADIAKFAHVRSVAFVTGSWARAARRTCTK